MEMSGLPSNTEDSQPEGSVLKIFEKLDVKVNSQNFEACHRLKSIKSFKKIIIKLSKHKDADKIRDVKKNLKSLKHI